MRLTKIYTKIGDKGTTLLATGARVGKESPRIEAYGTVDELNSHLGMLCDLLDAAGLIHKGVPMFSALERVQNELFDLGGELATPLELLNTERQRVVDSTSIERLESEMDLANETIPPLENFVLPGGSLANAEAHIARCVCRRAERLLVRLSKTEPVRSEALIYLNRLSDWLFVLARLISRESGKPERLWNQRLPAP
jgi:cob(I)alamin adenosyltransferase